jgi:hypothetical protein
MDDVLCGRSVAHLCSSRAVSEHPIEGMHMSPSAGIEDASLAERLRISSPLS